MLYGGTSIYYDGHQVAFGLNTVEAFITLGGILSRKGPKIVTMEMEPPENQKLVADHFDTIERHEARRRQSAPWKPGSKIANRCSKRG